MGFILHNTLHLPTTPYILGVDFKKIYNNYSALFMT